VDRVENRFHTGWAKDLRAFKGKVPREQFVQHKTKLFMTPD